MTVLVTRITPNMKKREGYIASPSDDTAECTDLTFSTFDVYIFNKCLKSTDPNFTQWLCYWPETNEAIMCNVLTKKLSTGYVKVTILSKHEVNLEDYGDFNRNKTVQYLYFENTSSTKLMNAKEVTESVIRSTLNDANQKHEKVTPKPNVQKKQPKGKSLTEYTPEEIAAYKKQIFG